MTLYCGIDLHANNCLISIVDEVDKCVLERRVHNDIDLIISTLSPYRAELAGCVVETTYNWYWLVDGLMDAGFPVHLAHTAAIPQYSGLKHSNDHTDARHLAHLFRLNILPTGYIYPRALRGTRDLLRRRLLFVHQHTRQLLSLQSLISRYTGQQLNGRQIQQVDREQLAAWLPDESVLLGALATQSTMSHLTAQIRRLERQVLSTPSIQADYRLFTSIRGVGEIIGLTLALETGNIERFPSPGQYASYARCVKTERVSNGKYKGRGNPRNGNRYLHWAFMEAAHYAVRWNQRIRQYYDRKRARVHVMSAKKAVANKLARACYHMLKRRAVFDVGRAFA